MIKSANYIHLFKRKQDTKAEFIRVDHAGELGAKYIYLGQLKVLKGETQIVEMLESEMEHLDYFEDYIKRENVRPSVLNSLWKECAFLMGFLSARIYKKSGAMLCTKEVEDVIEKHYEKQIKILDDLKLNEDLKNKIIKFREDEISHFKIGQSESIANRTFSIAVKSITHLAIILSKKF